jgi:hypothetical protein
MDEVRREYRRKPQDNPVDYAMLLNRTECLFVEAKSLEKDLRDHKWVMQNLTYATGAGVQWCVLTNGDEYRIYNAHAPVAAEERLFRSVRISETESKFLADTLFLLSKEMMRGTLLDELWKAHFVDRNVRAALDGLLADQDAGLARLIQKRAAALTPADIPSSVRDTRAFHKMGWPDAYGARGFSDGRNQAALLSVFVRHRRHARSPRGWRTQNGRPSHTLGARCAPERRTEPSPGGPAQRGGILQHRRTSCFRVRSAGKVCNRGDAPSPNRARHPDVRRVRRCRGRVGFCRFCRCHLGKTPQDAGAN